MGLALDEPKGDDEKHDLEGLEVYLDHFSRQAESINIDYVNHPYYGGFQVKSGSGGGCC